VELYDRLQQDDHNSPAFVLRPDDRLLTLFARHGDDSLFYYRTSEPDNWSEWSPMRTFIPTNKTRLTYSNVFLLPTEQNRIYNFFRGLDDNFKPSYVYSDDLGETWNVGNIFINVPSEFRHRPYVRYASNNEDQIHFFYTEGHPRRYDNSIYHMYYQNGMLHQSDGTPIRSLSDGLRMPEEGTLIFQGDSNNVAWTADIELDDQNQAYVAYSVQVDGAGLDYGEGGLDLRYRYARWDGTRWQNHPLAYAGTRLYAGEDDYTGLVALHPRNPDILYISTNADPVTGAPLMSEADGKRHYEIYRGHTPDGGATWHWTAVTEHSEVDNLRPIVPEWDSGRTALLWLRGTYRTYTDYDLEVMLLMDE
jgi:hypothetical protein